jgi:hypothetical protein
VVPSMAFCNYEEIIVAKLGKFFCNFVRFYYAINSKERGRFYDIMDVTNEALDL